MFVKAERDPKSVQKNQLFKGKSQDDLRHCPDWFVIVNAVG
jgi:hypothetical protein